MIDTGVVWVRAETAIRSGRDQEALGYLRQLVEVVDRIEFEYNEWLAKDHIRTVAERSHERADPSKMHEGGKFSGIPTDFTPGK